MSAKVKSKQLKVEVQGAGLQIGDLSVTFHRTLRIPDDGRDYPLPPSLGAFPLHRVDDYRESVPAAWREHGGVFLPMYQREAMWLSFQVGEQWRPLALKVAVGMVNALSGKPWSQELSEEEQDYLVCPPQPWLDGINAQDGVIKQFVAMPLGMGYTVEGQLSGEERFGGVQLVAFAAKDGRFKKPPLERSLRRGPSGQEMVMDAGFESQEFAGDVAFASLSSDSLRAASSSSQSLPKAAEMGLGAGGRMLQDIYPDPHGLDSWDEEKFGRVYVHIVNSEMYKQITGIDPPSSPVSVQTYAQHGYPWFDLYDEQLGDLKKSEILEGVKSVKEMDEGHGFEGQQDDSSVEIPAEAVVTYSIDPEAVRDGNWGAKQ